MGMLRRALLCCWLVLAAVIPTLPVAAQNVDLTDRPISRITLVGLDRVSEQTVLNNIRTSVGDPYDREVIAGDLHRLTRLGEFKYITPSGHLLDDGTVEVLYDFTEQKIIAEIQVVGNKLISDQDLLAVVRQFPGFARDDYLIQKARKDMEELYRKKGHLLTTVSVDEPELDETGILLFRVIEGPRVKVKVVTFEGNESFAAKRLSPEVKIRSAIAFLRAGTLDEDQLELDIVALAGFYMDRGYLDVRVGRRIDLSPDSREAKIVFLISEGRQYLLRQVRVENVVTGGGELEVFTKEQIAALLEIKSGDAFSQTLITKSTRIVEDAYGRLGYLNASVRPRESRVGAGAQADLVLEIDEGERADVGVVRIKGNFLTRDKVIRRAIRLEPGRPYDGTEIQRSRQRLQESRLFNDVRLTVQEPDPDDPITRDLLVEIKERDTGSVNFGLNIGSDNGLFGSISLRQDNFDIADFPASIGELFKGAAFRGAGQKFQLEFAPGIDLSRFLVSLTEPHLFESDYSGTGQSYLFTRNFDFYDEEAWRNYVSVGRRFGDIWQGNVFARYERVQLNNIDANAPVDVFESAGPDNLAGLGFNITRTTIPTLVRPGRGSRMSFTFERVGIFGEDVEFNKTEIDYTLYMTLDEDLLERKTTLRLQTGVGYIFGGDAPIYERFYLGGRQLRGFAFRTVSPKGIDLAGNQTDDPVGGNWKFYAGAQLEFPLFTNSVTGVVFVDTGTVTTNPSFDPYRVSIGTGVRLSIPQLGPVPIALDLGFPIVQDELDEEQIFSFRIDVPF